MLPIIAMFAATAAAATLPRHQLTAGFDLATGRIFGSSVITIPANRETRLELGDLSITYLRVDGKKIAVNQMADHTVTLPAVNREQAVTVSFEKVVATDPRNAHDNLVGKDGITLAGFWHPRLDSPCQFELVADVPASFTAIAEADVITEEPCDIGRRFRFRIEQPTESFHLIAGEYVVNETTFGDNKKLFTYFFKEDQQLAAHYRDKTLAYLNRYRKLIGEFPYQRFSVVENRLPTGYAMPTFTLLGQAVVRLPFITETSLGHEVLHQWFGNAVEIDYHQGNWAEGLTSCLADLAYAEEQGKGVDFRKTQLVKYQSYVSRKNELTLNQFGGGASHLASGQQQNRAVGYGKGAMVFHMLRKQIGDDAFYQGLRDFYQRMRYRAASWDDLRTSFESSSEQELSTFFDQWLNRADLPELVVRNIMIEEKEGRSEVQFTLLQKNKEPYHLLVPVLVGINEVKTITPVEVTDKETKVSLPFDQRPTELIIDPEHDLMRRMSISEMPPAWSRFNGAAKKLAVVADDAARERFAPLLTWLEEKDCEIKDNADATDKDVAKAATIFLGAASLSRSLFATPDHPATGFTVDVRNNPLNNKEVAVLVSADNVNETEAGLRKLRHYGKYGYLHFNNGHAVSKKMPEAERGLAYWLDLPPQAITVAKTQSFDDIVGELLKSRVIYVGEGHTKYEDHLLQLRIIRALHQHDPKFAIGMEMFNRSAQPALDEYITGTIDEAEMLRKTEYFKRWGYDYRNYRGIISFARLHQIPLVALNQEKEVVSKVFKDSSTSTLSEEENELLPKDRDLDMPGYQERIHRVFTMHAAPSPDQFKGFIQAQALWDETMAVSVADYLAAHPEDRMVVIAGVGHVAKAEAIPPRVARRINVEQAVVANINSTEADPKQIDYAFLLDPEQLPPGPIMGVMLTEKDERVLIEKLSPHGKAKDVGIKENDVIIALDGQPIKTVGDLKIIMLEKKKGDKVLATIKRKRAIFSDATLEIEVPL